MFKILQKTFATGIVTTKYPGEPAQVPEGFRGRPSFDFERWRDARPAADVCPTGAIFVCDEGNSRRVTVDYGLCVFCGLCADASPDQAIRITPEFELASADRRKLVLTAKYRLNADHTHQQLIEMWRGDGHLEAGVESIGQKAREQIHKLLRRSLAIRQVDAGSCNGCEVEIVALNNPVYDLERFGIHFVASPRHADMLLVTGPVTRNMELADQDLSSDSRSQGGGSGRGLRHQRRDFRKELCDAGRRGPSDTGRRVCAGLPAAPASFVARNPAGRWPDRAEWIASMSNDLRRF